MDGLMSVKKPIKMGILGAARIAPIALVKPARLLPYVSVEAIASRDINKAKKFSKKHDLPTFYGSYDDLLADPNIDAIYNPLPNGLHAEWTIKALNQGKHVLCEKPIASNTQEAEQMKVVAMKTGLNLTEAFHYRYHPLASRLKEIIDNGELGDIKKIEAAMCTPYMRKGNIRFKYNLGGGSTMDMGCYTINLVRYLTGEEPSVINAHPKIGPKQIDRYMKAELEFPSGIASVIQCGIKTYTKLSLKVIVHGTEGKLKCFNPYLPHIYHRLKIKTNTDTRTEKFKGKSTYYYQLDAFVKAISEHSSILTNIDEAILNMKVIDAIYKKASLKVRGT